MVFSTLTPKQAPPGLRTKLLSREDDVSGFACGDEPWAQSVSSFLKEDALDQQGKRLSNTYLFMDGELLVAYVSILAGGIHTATRRNMPKIGFDFAPLIQIGRLGVDRRYQGRGIAKIILDWVVAEAVQASFGVRGLYLYVDQDNDRARSVYEAYGFVDISNSARDSQRLLYYDLYTSS